MAIYTTAVAFSLPGATVLSITEGFLSGTAWGTVCIVISATLGATALFLIAKTAFGDAWRARAGPWWQNTEAGFRDNALSYLLVLCLVPLFPFFIVHLVPAFAFPHVAAILPPGRGIGLCTADRPQQHPEEARYGDANTAPGD
jgi:uncharacterized membrane protein YdjX (TVP38/TMEM64 family)